MVTAQKIRSKLRRETKYLGRDIGFKLGLHNNFYREARGSRIVLYHGICKTDHTRFNPIFLTARTFEQHLVFYKKYFNIVSLNDLYEGHFSRSRFNVCITFDDGFANNYHYVLPLLEKYQLPAAFFITAIRATGHDILWNDFLGIVSKYGPKNIVYKDKHYYKGLHDKYISAATGISLVNELRSTGFTEKAEMMELLYPLVPFKGSRSDMDHWLQMTEAQIKTLSASPFATIGSHGYYHNDLALILPGDAHEELTLSKRYLENLTGKEVTSIAFPYGAYTPQVVAAAKHAGYIQLLATDLLLNHDIDDNLMRERFTVNPFISTGNQMYATIKRRYEQ